MISVREERMADFFTKFHLEGLPRAAVLHHFAEPDHGDPHDHPWPFRSFIISGGYTEQVFKLDGSRELVHHFTGDAFDIPASHIHRIVHMPASGVWTLILPGRPERKSGFYRFEDGHAYHRFWDASDFVRMDAAAIMDAAGVGQARAA